MIGTEPNAPEAEWARAREVLRRHEGPLLNKPNVVGVGIGEDASGGLILVVMVRRKVPANQLPEGGLVPAELEGLAVDVREIGELTAHGSEGAPTE